MTMTLNARSALTSLIKIVNELTLVFLASNDTLLGTEVSWRKQTVSWSGLLRRFVLKVTCR